MTYVSDELGSLRDQIRQFVVRNISHKELTKLEDHESLIECGAIDSLGIFRLVAFLEETFGLRIADEEISYENFQSILSIERFVQVKLNRGDSEPGPST